MKYLLNLICIFFIASSVFAQDQWFNYSSPFPIKAAIPTGDGLLLSTGGGLRFRAQNLDDVFTTSKGLGEQSMSAVAISDLGAFAVSESGVISMILSNGTWQVLSRSYTGNNTHVIPGLALLGGPVLVIAFEDRLSFFNLRTMTSILTVERIADINVSAYPITAMDIHGDSLIIAAGGGLYMRKMDWENLDTDVQLYDPDSWKIIKNASINNEPIKSIAWKDGEMKTFPTEGMRIWDKDGETRVALDTFSVFTDDKSMVMIRGKVLKDSILYERDSVEIKDRDKKRWLHFYKSKVRWVSLLPSGKAILAGPEIILYYDNGKFTDLTEYKPFPLGIPYELQALPVGGVLVATEEGRFSHFSYSWNEKKYVWSEPTYAVMSGNGSDARAHNLKTLSVLPDGGTFYHHWADGYAVYSGWADMLTAELYLRGNDINGVPNRDKYCMDNYFEGNSNGSIAGILAVSSTPAPNNNGYLTTSASKKGYSLVYVENGKDERGPLVSCAKNVGSATIGGPMFARVDENGNWVVYVGTREATSTDANGGLDVFVFPPVNKMGGNISKVDTSYRKTYSGAQSTPLDLVYEPITDYVWMVTASTLVYWDKDDKDLKTPLSTNGLTGADYTSIDVDSRGNLWVGTKSQGAYRLTPRKTSPDTLSVMHFTTRHGLLSEGIQDVAVDTVLGMVWFAHDNGVTGYKRDDVRGTEKNMTDKAYEDVKVYPIPFRPKLQPYISFFNVADDAVINIYNRGGRLVVSLSGNQISGGRATWNGRMENGSLVAPGVYQYVIRGGTKVRKGKLLIIH